MYIREVSDIHLEFGDFHLPEMPEDKDTVLVLAGDIGLARRIEQLGAFLLDCSVRFKAVIYILGNHEHYHYALDETAIAIHQRMAYLGLNNVFLMENETKVIDNVAFICATLWTDYDNDKAKLVLANHAMNDHRLIVKSRNNLVLFTPAAAQELHFASRQFVFEAVKTWRTAGFKRSSAAGRGGRCPPTAPGA